MKKYELQVGVIETSPSPTWEEELETLEDIAIPSYAEDKDNAPISARRETTRIGGAKLTEIVIKSESEFQNFYEKNNVEFENNSQELLETLIMTGSATKNKLALLLGLGRCNVEFMRSKTYVEIQHLEPTPAIVIFIESKLKAADPDQDIGPGLTQLIKTYKVSQHHRTLRSYDTSDTEDSDIDDVTPGKREPRSSESLEANVSQIDKTLNFWLSQTLPNPDRFKAENFNIKDDVDIVEKAPSPTQDGSSSPVSTESDGVHFQKSREEFLLWCLPGSDRSQTDTSNTMGGAGSPTRHDTPKDSFAAKFSPGVESKKKRLTRGWIETEGWAAQQAKKECRSR